MNLVPLYEEAIQFNNFNGTVLAAGKVEVWYLGRTRKADIYADVAGETPLPNPFDLNNLGMQEVYVNPAFNYTLVVYDAYGSELFSVDKYLQGADGHTTSNVVVQPSEHIGVSAWTVGEVQIYQPYLVGEVGKTYEGISPIVVNNTLNRISANHIPLGVQDPLYFVEDSETACIIGCSAQTEIPAELSGKWDEASDTVITNSAQWAEGTEYEEGSYISIDNNVISVTGLSPVPADTASIGLVASVSADITAMIPDTSDMATQTWVNEQGFLTAHQSLDGLMSADLLEFSGSIITAYSGYKFAGEISGDPGDPEVNTLVHSNSATWNNVTAKLDTTAFSNVSGTFLTAHQDLSNYQTTAGMTAYQPVGDYYSASNPSGFITGVDLTPYQLTADMTAYQPAGDYLTTADSANFYTTANESGFITGIDIPESANWNATTEIVSSNSAQWGATNQQIPVTGINGIKISESADKVVFEVSGDYYPGNNPSGFITGVDLSNYATTAQVSEKLDTTAFSDVSGTFLTAHQDLSDYQTTAGMTAYQPVGDYLTTANSGEFYTTANESGFITGVPNTYLQNTDLTIVDNKITEISGVPLSGGGEVPQGVMVESGLEYDNTEISGYSGSAFKDVALTNTVTANSGAWGGSALPVSAGPGVKISLQNDTLVFETDETILASGIANDATAFTLSEEAGNFERLRLYDTYGNIVEVAGDNSRLTWVFDRTNANGTRMNRCYTISSTDGIQWNEVNVYGWNQTAYTGELSLNGGTDWYLETYKVVGINRISAGE